MTPTDTQGFGGGLSVDQIAREKADVALVRKGGGGTLLVAAVDAPPSVKDMAHYVCDGIADEAEINSALGIGSVQLTDGTYTLSAPIEVTHNGQSLSGTGPGIADTNNGAASGRYGTLIVPAVGFTGDAVVAARTPGNFPVAGVTLQAFKVQGNAVGTSLKGVHFRVYDGIARDIECRNMSGHGFVIKGAEGSTYWGTYESQFDNIVCGDNTGDGFRGERWADDIHLMNIKAFRNGGSGISLQSCVSWQLTGFHAYDNGVHGVFFNNTGTRSKVVNGKIEANAQHGFYFDGTTGGASQVQLMLIGFNSNGTAANNTYHHIHLGGNNSAYAWRISNIDIGQAYTGGVFANKAKRGMWINSTVTQTKIHDISIASNAFITEAMNAVSGTGSSSYNIHAY